MPSLLKFGLIGALEKFKKIIRNNVRSLHLFGALKLGEIGVFYL